MPRYLNDPELETRTVSLDSNFADRPVRIPAFVARPRSCSTRLPGIVVVQEIFGVNDHIKDLACQFALQGFIAIAPEMYVREGVCPPMTAGREKVMAFLGAIPDEQVLSDIGVARRHLLADSNCTGKVGIVGYCWGGRIAMRSAASRIGLDAAVAYYGRIAGPTSLNQPAHPLDEAAEMRVPLQGHFGAEDQGIPAADAVRLRDALKAHGKVADIHVYEQAGHAFSNDTRPDMYRPGPAKLAFERSVAWFKKYLRD